MILQKAQTPKKGWPWDSSQLEGGNQLSNKTKYPRVTVVTPSYNQADFVEETIRSVLLQGYPNLEYWIIDGGSIDGSVDIIRRYEPWLAGWVSEKDQGQAAAINKGWAHSSGEYLAWINSDDIYLPGAIMSSVDYLLMHPDVGFVYGDLELINESGNPSGLMTYEEFDVIRVVKEAGWISQPGNMVRRSVLDKIGLLDESLHFQMDLDLWIRAGLVCKFGYIRRPLAQFRQHADSKTTSRIQLAALDIIKIYTKLFNRHDLPLEFRKIERNAWANAYLYAANIWILSNNLLQGIRSLIIALRKYPRLILGGRIWFSLGQIMFALISGGRKSSCYQLAKGILKKIGYFR